MKRRIQWPAAGDERVKKKEERSKKKRGKNKEEKKKENKGPEAGDKMAK